MKRLFVVLLVLNGLFFLWWQFDAPDENVLNTSPLSTDRSQSLVLLSEIGKEDESRAGSDSIDVVKAIPSHVIPEIKEVVIADVSEVGSMVLQPDNKTNICYTIGPIADQSRAETVLTELTKLGAKVSQRIEQGSILVGYRVYISPLPSMEGARGMLQALKKQGIKDSVIIHKGGYKNGISLGVFSKQDGANRHLEAMIKKGFDAKMANHYRDSEQYWFDIDSFDQVSSASSEWARISDQYPEMKKQVINCK